MNETIEVKLRRNADGRVKASVLIGDVSNGISISNISVWKTEDGGLKIVMPVLHSGDAKQPAVILRGDIKNRVFGEIRQSFLQEFCE